MNIIESRGWGLGLVTTDILGWMYWFDRRDNVGHGKKEGYLEKGGYVCMYVTKGGGGWDKRDFEKNNHREQDYAISKQYWVCKLEEMGLDMLLRNK